MAEPVPPDFDIPLPPAIPTTGGTSKVPMTPPISVQETQKAIDIRMPPSPTPKQKEEAKVQVGAIKGLPRTPAGELTPTLEFIDWALPDWVPESLHPQVKATPEQAEAERRAAAAEQKRKQDLQDSIDAKNKAMLEGKPHEAFTPEEIHVISGPTPLEAIAPVIEWATQTENRKGGISETPIGYGFRALFSGVNAAIGSAESLATGRPIAETTSERVKSGLGFYGVGTDVGAYAGDKLEEHPVLASYANMVGIDKESLKSAGGLIGFGLDLLIPVDLGVISAVGEASKLPAVLKESSLLNRATEAARTEENIASATEHLSNLENVTTELAAEPRDILSHAWENAETGVAQTPHEKLIETNPSYKEYVDKIRKAGFSENPLVDIVEVKNVMKNMLDEEIISGKSTVDSPSTRSIQLKDALARTGYAAEPTGIPTLLSLPEDAIIRNEVISNVLNRNLKKNIAREFVSIADNSLAPRTATKKFAEGARKYIDTIIPKKELDKLKGVKVSQDPRIIEITPERARKILEPIAYDLDLKNQIITSKPLNVEEVWVSNPAVLEILKSRVPQVLHTRLDELVSLSYGLSKESIMITPAEWNNIQVSIINRLAEVVPSRISKIESIKAEPFYFSDKALSYVSTKFKESLKNWFTIGEQLSPVAKELENSVRSKFSSLIEDFKYQIRSERAKLGKLGGSTKGDEAFSNVVFKEWESEFVDRKIDSFVNKILDSDSAADLFNDWMRTVYGGYEDITSIIKHESGQTSSGISPKRLKEALEGAKKDSDYFKRREGFVKLILDGNKLGALDYLATQLKELSESKINIKQLLGEDISGNIGSIPVFDLNSATETIAITYLNKKAANIFNDEIKTWASKYNIIPDAGTNWIIGNEIEGRIVFDIFNKIRNIDPNINIEIVRDLVKKAELSNDIIPSIAAQNVAELINPGSIATDMRTSIEKKLLDALNSVDENYIKFNKNDIIEILNSVRTTPALVEWTMPIKQMFKDNLSIDDLKSLAKAFSMSYESKSPVSAIQSISSAFKDSAELKSQLMSATELENFSKEIEHLKVKDLPPRFTEYAGDKLMDLQLHTSNRARAGVLSGYVVPNFKYLVNNFLSGPAIIWQTLGGQAAAKAMISGHGSQVLRELYKPLSYGASSDKVLFVTADGRIYLTSDIAKIVAKSNITKSLGSFEITKQIIDDIVVWSGKNSKGLKRNIVSDYLKRNFSPSERQSILGEVAAASDTYFRTKVLTQALKEGRSEAEAIELARTSLFDYGKLEPWERASFAKAFWFYSFMRHSLVSSFKMIYENPSRAAHLYKLSQGFPEDGQYHEDTNDYSESKPFLELIKSNKGSYALYGPKVPFVDSAVQLIDYLSLISPAVLSDPTRSADRKISDTWQGILLRLASNMNPAYTTIPAAVTGVNVQYGDIKPIGEYIDPKFLFWLSKNQAMWDKFTFFVPLQPKKWEDVKSTDPLFNGVAWEIATPAGKRNWYLIQQAILAVGLQRALRDYSDYDLSGMTKEEKDQSDSILQEIKNTGLEAGQITGAITGVKEPSQTEIIRRQTRKDLKEE